MEKFEIFVEVLRAWKPMVKTGISFPAFVANLSIVELLGLVVATTIVYRLFRAVVKLTVFLFEPQPPKVVVPLNPEESEDVLTGKPKFDYTMIYNEQGKSGDKQMVHLFDPATLDYFGSVPAMSEAQVKRRVATARDAQAQWKTSSFAKRRLLMRTMQRYITEHADVCARVSSRESGAFATARRFCYRSLSAPRCPSLIPLHSSHPRPHPNHPRQDDARRHDRRCARDAGEARLARKQRRAVPCARAPRRGPHDGNEASVG